MQYIQFPLFLLAYGPENDEKTLWKKFFCYSLLEYSSEMLNKESNSGGSKFIQDSISDREEYYNEKGDEEDELHNALIFVLDRLELRLDSECVHQYHAEMSEHLKKIASDGNDALVRIKSDFLIGEDSNRSGINYFDLRVLSAIYSVIGQKKYALIRREQIGMRALGFRNNKLYEPFQTSLPRPSIKKLRHSLDKLEAKGFFTSVTVKKRMTYHSIRMPQAELAKLLSSPRTSPQRSRLQI